MKKDFLKCEPGHTRIIPAIKILSYFFCAHKDIRFFQIVPLKKYVAGLTFTEIQFPPFEMMKIKVF